MAELSAIINAIEDTLDAAASLLRSQSYDQLTEGIHDYPLLQVYVENNDVDRGQQTERTSFTGATRQKGYTVYADVYARQRSNIAEDMAQLVTTVDELEDILEAQDALVAHSSPLFGLTEAGHPVIRSFRWSWSRVVFEYGGVQYMGARFVLNLIVF